MRRLARLLSFLGAAAVVFGLSKVHAAWIADPPYDFTGSFRFAWAVGYVLLLWVLGYGFGLPELPRSIGSATVTAITVSACAAAGDRFADDVRRVIGEGMTRAAETRLGNWSPPPVPRSRSISW